MKSRRQSKLRRRVNWEGVLITLAPIIADGGRFAFLSAFGLFLFWVVMAKSLPYAFARLSPDTALFLSPNNPAALMAKAERVRDKLLKASTPPSVSASQVSESATLNTIAKLPEDKSGGFREPSDRDALRKEVRRLAARTMAVDPLNAEAFRLMGEMADDRDQVRILMQEAAKRSRHEAPALVWLLNDSVQRRDFSAALDQADILMRTWPQASGYVVKHLALIAEDANGLPLLAEALAKGPPWRPSFFVALPSTVKRIETPLDLMMALKQSAKPCVDKEVAPYLTTLIAKNAVEFAYNVFLQFLPASELDHLDLIMHANFERDPTGLPFDWRIARGVNATNEFVPVGAGGERALHFAFGYGRIQFPEVSQHVLLAPGNYRLEGKLRGSVVGKRGLRWRLRCAGGARQVLGETEMLLGESKEWRIFALQAQVPQVEDCRAQELRLFHDSARRRRSFCPVKLGLRGCKFIESWTRPRLNKKSQHTFL